MLYKAEKGRAGPLGLRCCSTSLTEMSARTNIVQICTALLPKESSRVLTFLSLPIDYVHYLVAAKQKVPWSS